MSKSIAALLQKANTLFTQGNNKQALKLANEVLKTDTKDHEALIIKANALHVMKDLDHSIPAFEKILELYPDNHTVIIILMQHYSSKKDWEKLSVITRHALQYPQQANTFTQAYIELHGLCDWESLNKIHNTLLETINNNRDNPIIFQQLLFTLLALPGFSEEDIFETHKVVAQRFMDLADGKQYTSYKKAGKKLKIGYVSGDLALHPVGVFVQFCVELHNRNCFDIYCYADLVYTDDLTDKFRTISDHFIDITEQPAEQVAKKIHDDGIDILIDLGGYTGRVLLEIFTYKPAPVQISYCGYPYSTALPTIDYRISDPYAEGSIKNYTEELIFMPDSFLCMGGGYSHTICTPAPCEKNGHITFGTFNDLRKINIPVIQLWSKVLAATPDSKLLIRNRKVEGFFARRIYDQFEQCGIGKDRLIFIHGNLSAEEHCKYYSEVDIVLDVFPFCGATTSLETLWYNVPIITLVGEAHRQRPTYSMLKNIGFTEGVAFTEDEYVEKATAMAAQAPQALTLIRHCIYTLARASILFQPEAFTHQLDQLYLDAWNKKMNDDRHIKADEPEYSYKFPLRSPLPMSQKLDTSSDDTAILVMHDDIVITVPNTITLLTPYVVAEQQDWFEREVGFIRTLLQAGMMALDIGASYGTYSLTIARKIGATGHLWSFEPHSQTIEYLTDSIGSNDFTNVSPLNIALSNKEGSASLYLNPNSEYCSLQPDQKNHNLQNNTPLRTLDSYLEKYKWENIDFVKIDTMGEELKIVQGGQSFFSTLSPLVMFAYTIGNTDSQQLIEAFKSLRYDIYILIPGLQIIAPFNQGDVQDGFLLNLFCCKEDMADKLQKRGLLAPSLLCDGGGDLAEDGWETYMEAFPYSSSLLKLWKNRAEKALLPEWPAYKHCLNLYVAAHSKTLPPSQRVVLLNTAFVTLTSLLDLHITIPRLLTLIRIAIELGRREVAIQLLDDVIANLHDTNTFNPDEPFLAVSETAEKQGFNNNLAGWCLAYAIAEKELQSSLSSFFLDNSSFKLLEGFEASNFPHEAMHRRFKVMNHRLHAKPEEESIVRELHIGGATKAC